MRVVIFGASGGTGRLLVEQALAQDYEVTAFDRHETALTIQHPRLSIVQGDVFNPAQVEAAITRQEAVFCVLGVKATTTQPVCSTGTMHILMAMQKQGVKRLICQSALMVAAFGSERRELSWVLPTILPLFPNVRAMFADKVLQEQFICQSNLDWVIVRPATLTDGPRTGRYTVGVPLKMGLNAKITRADVADFLLKQLGSDTYIHKVPRIRY